MGCICKKVQVPQEGENIDLQNQIEGENQGDDQRILSKAGAERAPEEKEMKVEETEQNRETMVSQQDNKFEEKEKKEEKAEVLEKSLNSGGKAKKKKSK